MWVQQLWNPLTVTVMYFAFTEMDVAVMQKKRKGKRGSWITVQDIHSHSLFLTAFLIIARISDPTTFRGWSTGCTRKRKRKRYIDYSLYIYSHSVLKGIRLITKQKPKVWQDQYVKKGEEGGEEDDVLDHQVRIICTQCQNILNPLINSRHHFLYLYFIQFKYFLLSSFIHVSSSSDDILFCKLLLPGLSRRDLKFPHTQAKETVNSMLNTIITNLHVHMANMWRHSIELTLD